MGWPEVQALAPLLVISATSVVLMLVIAFVRSHAVAFAIAVAGLVIAFASLPLSAVPGVQQVTALLVMDGYARFYQGLLILGALAVALLSYGYLRAQPDTVPEEYYLLLLLATLGGAVLAASTHFASFFLGLEILSVSLYALIAYRRTSDLSVEAGVKYLVLAGVSSAFLLFGMALVYAETGSMAIGALGALRSGGAQISQPVMLTGVAMMVIGIGYKLAVVPFHMWTPDVYEGAPAPVTAFIASVSKGGMFALLLRYFVPLDVRAIPSVFAVFAVIAVASMLIGNWLALLQNNVKRVLAYSSIAHLGYMLVAFLGSGVTAIVAGTLYLVAYFITILTAFGVVTILSGGERDADSIENYRGLYWQRPWAAGVLSVALLSLAGLPLTAGFVGKFYILLAGVGGAQWALAIVLIVGSAISLYYYLRIIVAMFHHGEGEVPAEPAQAEPAGSVAAIGPAPALTWASGLTLALLLIALVWIGIYPAPLISLIEGVSRL